MADVFISYVEEDSRIAIELSERLEASGYSTWCYERHSVPGPSYLAQTRGAIEQCRVFVLLISRDSLGSSQIDKEVVRAHETSKRFLPILLGVTHPEFHARQPEWGQAAGGATAIAVPADGVAEIVPRIVRGLQMMKVEPGGAELSEGQRSQTGRVQAARSPQASAITTPSQGSGGRTLLGSILKFYLRAAAAQAIVLAIGYVGHDLVMNDRTRFQSAPDIARTEASIFLVITMFALSVGAPAVVLARRILRAGFESFRRVYLVCSLGVVLVSCVLEYPDPPFANFILVGMPLVFVLVVLLIAAVARMTDSPDLHRSPVPWPAWSRWTVFGVSILIAAYIVASESHARELRLAEYALAEAQFKATYPHILEAAAAFQRHTARCPNDLAELVRKTRNAQGRVAGPFLRTSPPPTEGWSAYSTERYGEQLWVRMSHGPGGQICE